jgi:hypothetical protein
MTFKDKYNVTSTIENHLNLYLKIKNFHIESFKIHIFMITKLLVLFITLIV